MSELSVVVPCYNEEGSIALWDKELFPALESLGVPYEVIAVDDGATDGTAAALRALSAKRPLTVVRHESNRGLGAALRTGFAAARGEWIVALDADLTFDPRLIAALLARQRETGADLVAGSPFLERSSGVPLSRRLPSAVLNAFYRGLISPKLTAYTPMFRLYRRAALARMKLASEGFELSAEIAARFVRAGLKVAEVPAPLTTRRAGVSKLSRWRELKRHARLVLRLMTSR